MIKKEKLHLNSNAWDAVVNRMQILISALNHPGSHRDGFFIAEVLVNIENYFVRDFS